MTNYKVTNKRNQVATIEAEHYEQTGSGTYFYGPEGMICSFADGEIKSVVPETIDFVDENAA